MGNNVFKINLNTEILDRLRDKINEHQNISYNKEYGKYRAWDKICAIMDRLDDTVYYLNQLELNIGKYERSAFDFFDFMNNSAVVMDCIKDLAEIFQVEDQEIKTSTDIFNELGRDGKGTDKKYFEYLRSLCSVHPVQTNRHKTYQDNDFECSPYVVWNDKRIWHNDDSDIYAVVYTSKDGDSFKRVHIYIDKIFKYISKRVDFIETIINYIDEYQQGIIESYRKREIKKEDCFDNYVDYIENLKEEVDERYGDDHFNNFDYLIKLFNLKLSNHDNQEKMDLYLSVLKYAIKFEHNSIQNMSYDGFENNGLLYPQNNIETSLLNELKSLHSGSPERYKYAYQMEKISYLSYDNSYSNIRWAYIQLESILPFLEKYVTFEKVESNFESYALVKLALYLECLDSDCLINKNIPNSLRYRLILKDNNSMS